MITSTPFIDKKIFLYQVQDSDLYFDHSPADFSSDYQFERNRRQPKGVVFLFYSWELSVRQHETRILSEQNLTVHWVYYFLHFDIYSSTRSQKSRFLFYCKKHRKRYNKGLFITPVFDEDESRCLIQYKNPLKFEFSIILQETNDHQY